MAVVEELLSRGAKIDAATKKGNTALHIASLAGQVKLYFFRLCFLGQDRVKMVAQLKCKQNCCRFTINKTFS